MNKIKNTDHFYLVDGSGYIFRAYYALPPLSRKSDGLPTGAVSGFSNMLFNFYYFFSCYFFLWLFSNYCRNATLINWSCCGIPNSFKHKLCIPKKR